MPKYEDGTNSTVVLSESCCPRCKGDKDGVYAFDFERAPAEAEVFRAQMKGITPKTHLIAVFECPVCTCMWMERWNSDDPAEMLSDDF